MRYCRVAKFEVSDVHEGEEERVWPEGHFCGRGGERGVNAKWGNEMDWVDGSVHY